MRKLSFIALLAAGLLAIQVPAHAQTDIEIGKTTIRLQSPIEFYEEEELKEDIQKNPTVFRSYSFTDCFFGFSFPVPGCNYEPTAEMPVMYGNSFEIQFGVKRWYRVARHYAFGFSMQYSHYDYRGSGLAKSGMIAQYPEDIVVRREIFKTDNLGIGIYNRFYLSAVRPTFYLDIGAYGDWAFSRQYKVKYYLGDSKAVDHYRDGSKFLPLQGGIYGAVGIGAFSVYCKYRFSNMFRHTELPMEPPRLTIGLMIAI